MNRAVVLLGLFLTALLPLGSTQGADVTGGLVITGHGPERPLIEDLARAFEKEHPFTYVDINWSPYAKILRMVRSGEADIAVAGKGEPDLDAHQIAWDGIVILVNATNSTNELSKQQVADVFTGKVKFWSELGGPEERILIVDRHPTQNLTYAFEQSLGIEGKIPPSAEVIGPEQKATNRVVGALPPYSAVTYMSMHHALLAVRTGAGVRALLIDKVEPEQPTVKDGRYPLRRPVLFLTRKERTPVVDAFIKFTLSPKGQQIVEKMFTSLDRAG